MKSFSMYSLLEYYFMTEILFFITKLKNTKLQQMLYNCIYSVKSTKQTKLYSLCQNAARLTKDCYDRTIELDDIDYTICKISLNHSKSLHDLAKECLENIIKKKTVCLNGIPIQIEECILVDVFNTSLTKFNHFHTDLEYLNFTGPAFNVWYLTENNETTGNMFLLESDDYKKEYTPCCISDDYAAHTIEVKRHSYIGSILNKYEKMGTLDDRNLRITYTNMKNSECLIMTKHLPHRTDLSRNNQFKGFNFRVVLKNKDGSVNYHNKYKKIKPYHVYDQHDKKIYGCRLLDFV